MPVYVYHCGNCDFEFEQQQKFTDKPLKNCPECGQSTLHKVYTPVGVIYKGSGYYSTDHRSGSSSLAYSKGKKDESKDETKGEKKDVTKEEKKSKPEKTRPVKTGSDD